MTKNAASRYLAEVTPRLERLAREADDGAFDAACDLIVESLEAGGVLQAFGTGHSEAFAMEIAGRAGGLIPTNRLALRDAVAAAGVATDPEAAGLLERDASLAQHIYDLALGAEPQDVFL